MSDDKSYTDELHAAGWDAYCNADAYIGDPVADAVDAAVSKALSDLLHDILADIEDDAEDRIVAWADAHGIALRGKP